MKKLLVALIILLTVSPVFALNTVELGAKYYANPASSRALFNADIYVGEPDLDPEVLANQKQLSVLQENGTVVAVAQPISTGAGGVPLYNGSYVTLLVEGDYSLKVLDSTGSQIYYVPQTNVDPVLESVESIAEMTSLNPSNLDSVFLLGRTIADGFGSGIFIFDSSDLSVPVAVDTVNGIYAAPDSDVTGASGAWVRDYEGAIIPEWFGIAGTSDDSVAFSVMVDVADGDQIRIDRTVRLDTISSYPVTTDIDFIGYGTLDGNSQNTAGFIIGADISYLKLNGLTFTDFGGRIIWDNNVTSREVDYLEVTKCIFKDSKSGIELQSRVAEAVVRGNTFENLVSTGGVYGVQLGSNVFADQDLFGEYVVSNNVFDTLTTSLNGGEAHAILLRGKQCTITGNVIRTVQNGDASFGAEAIYTKIRYGTINGNSIIDGGGGEASINIKGDERGAAFQPYGYDINCFGNTLYSSVDTHKVGIQSQIEDVNIFGNYLEGFSLYAITVNDVCTNVSVYNNTITRFVGLYAIFVTADGKSLAIEDNNINHLIGDSGETDLRAIAVFVRAGGIDNLIIDGNKIYDDGNVDVAITELRGIQISSLNDNIGALSIKDNKVTFTGQTANIRGIAVDSGAFTIDEFFYSGNSAIVETTGTGLPANIGQSTASLITTFRGSSNQLYDLLNELNIEMNHNLATLSNVNAIASVQQTLPVAQPGLEFKFNKLENFAYTIRPDQTGADFIRGGAALKYISPDALGDTFRLRCEVSGIWEVEALVGTVSYEP